jgi:hypothetical protein
MLENYNKINKNEKTTFYLNDSCKECFEDILINNRIGRVLIKYLGKYWWNILNH